MSRPSHPAPISLLTILSLMMLPAVGFSAADQAEQQQPRDPGPTMLALAAPPANLPVHQSVGVPDTQRSVANAPLDLKLMIHRVTVGQ